MRRVVATSNEQVVAPDALRSGRALVELFADDGKLVRGPRRTAVRLKAFGECVRNMGLELTGLLPGKALGWLGEPFGELKDEAWPRIRASPTPWQPAAAMTIRPCMAGS